MSPGEIYNETETWVGFRITFQYPNADVYPHYVRGDLSRRDRGNHSAGIQAGYTFEDRSALQLSRRSNRLNPAIDSAALKLLKVLEWLRTRS